MKNSITRLIQFLLIMMLLASCQEEKETPLKIAMAKAISSTDFGNYGKWLRSVDTTLIIADMYSLPLDSAVMVLESCSGLLLNGGADVYPGIYGKEEDTSKCGWIDHKRDKLEFSLIDKALELDMPILGICRGLQVFNVYNGGSLFADIPTDYDTLIKHRCKDTYDCFHKVEVKEGSMLYMTSQVKEEITNSNHHQGIDRLSDRLQATAFSEDGLIEGIQWIDTENKAFFLGVQWHPERMEYTNPLSLPIAMYFLREVKEYSLEKQNAK